MEPKQLHQLELSKIVNTKMFYGLRREAVMALPVAKNLGKLVTAQ